jgi:hypothetical protein
MMAGVATTVPVDRLLKNLSRYVTEHPENARGWYELGRVQSLAFVQGADTISADYGLTRYPPALSLERIGFYASERRPGSNLARTREHLDEAIRDYRKAAELDSTQAMYFLGLGWILQQGAKEAPLFGRPPDLSPCRLSSQEKTQLEYRIGGLTYEKERSAAFESLLVNLPCAMDALLGSKEQSEFQGKLIRRLVSRAWEDEALKAYRQAIELSFEREYKNGGDSDGSAICVEAGEHIFEILRWSRLAQESTPESRDEIAHVDSLLTLYRGVNRAISPIVFPMNAVLSLTEIANPKAVVPFDLDGTGEVRVWPWIRANAAFLVWDPLGEGHITSGRQLFGNVTWWMFWKDGYHALQALDDDANGWLEGTELDGIGVWHDANTNGVSDPGEVSPVAATVARIAVVPDRQGGQVLSNRWGIIMRSGRILPTYDWLPRSVGLAAIIAGDNTTR